MTRKREIIIQKSEENRQLIDWLASRYTYHNKDVWTEYILNQRVTINGIKVTPETLLKNNDKVIYYPEPIIEPPINRNYETIFEDNDLLVINKPNDIPCHPGGIYFENTLWYILKEKYEYISLINRLDRETSGVMLIAKNKISAKFYFNKMLEREVEKEYLVLVHGEVNQTLNGKGWLVPDGESIIRKKRAFIPDSNASQPIGEGDPNKQYSCTEFTTIKIKNSMTLLKCKLLTGRTHQIRATINSLGFPVVGDKIYGLDDTYFFKFINDELTEIEWNKLILKNQGLHSYKTKLPMMDGTVKEFVASKPLEWPV